MPSRTSGLVHGEPTRLTPDAGNFVESVLLPVLVKHGGGRGARSILTLLEPESSVLEPQGKHETIVKAIARLMKPRRLKRERDFFRHHLLHGGNADDTQGKQEQLARLLEATLDINDFEWSPGLLGQLVKEAKANGTDWQPLAHRLERIRICESVLAPCSMLFTHLLGLHDQSVSRIRKRLSDEWGDGLPSVHSDSFKELSAEISDGEPTTGDRWVAVATALERGDYTALVMGLIEQNATVMQARGGAPWIEKRGNKLHVRFRDEQGSLPTREELKTLWRFPYFLNSLRTVAGTLRDAA